MGIRDKLKKEKSLSVVEAKQRLYDELSNYTKWKLSVSSACLKKTVHDIVFEMRFYYSKYNVSYEDIGVSCEFLFWNKKLNKQCNVESKMGFISFKPQASSWYDITTDKKLNKAIEKIKKQMDDFVLPLIIEFDDDYDNALDQLYNDLKKQEIYHLSSFKSYEIIRNH